jgi:penicillin-binding protein 1A
MKTLAAYAPALDLGNITAATVVDDAPYDARSDGFLTEYIPSNWYGRNTYEGLTHARRGLYHSMNILAVRHYMMTGIDASFQYLLDFGFTTLVEGEWRSGNRWLTDRIAAVPLGGLTDGVTQVELCAAYGAIANLGEYNKPIFYTRVLDQKGNVLLENDMQPRRVLRNTTAYILTDMSRDTMRVGTGRRANFETVQIPVAGKTGTSQDTMDLSFTGWTPFYVASVWMGFDQQKKIEDTNAYHLRVWRRIMEEVHRDLPMRDFLRPDGITSAIVCRDSGMLAGDLCRRDPRGNRAYTEIFASGTQPVTICEVHQELTICVVSGHLASVNCPQWDRQTRLGIVRPEPIDYSINPSANVRDAEYELSRDAANGVECTEHGFSFTFPIVEDGYNPFFNMDGIIRQENTPITDPNDPIIGGIETGDDGLTAIDP